ncbi:MAG: hypothetical protein LBI70_02340 [Rickettsiales bacterium]|jgi:F-type H+-transporting ATPase subunit b|nr:hypothetical protein [Rickettsiales bacterium]
MNIDILTLLSQVVNFLLLMFILKKFLYKPVAKLIHDRQEYIKSTIENAEDRLREAESKKEAYQNELDSIDNQKKKQTIRITEELAEYRTTEFEKLREEIEIKKVEFLKHLDSEKADIVNNIIGSICLNMGDFLVDVFASLTGNSFESSILNNFLEEIVNFPNELTEKINKSSGGAMTFVSSFELNAAQKTQVEKVFRERCISYNSIDFEINKNIGLGHRIAIGNLTINSNIRDIVDQFRTKLEQSI